MQYTVENIRDATTVGNHASVLTIRAGKRFDGEVLVRKRWRWVNSGEGKDFVVTEGIDKLFPDPYELEEYIYEKLTEKMNEEFVEELSNKLAARFGQKEKE